MTQSNRIRSGLRRPLDEPLAPQNRLNRLIEHARSIRALDAKLRRVLPADLAAHCRLGNWDSDRLVYMADTSLWAAKLRLKLPELETLASDLLKPIKPRISVKVARPLPPIQQSQGPKRLSAAAAERLRLAADSVADPELRALFLGLASVPDRR